MRMPDLALSILYWTSPTGLQKQQIFLNYLMKIGQKNNRKKKQFGYGNVIMKEKSDWIWIFH